MREKWLRWRGGRFTDKAFLEATAEVFALRKQVQRLKDAMERDMRQHIADRREWLRKEADLVSINHDLAAQLAASDGQLIAYGLERR